MQVASISDSTLSGPGAVGLWGVASATFDNVSVNTAGHQAAALPTSDSFSSVGQLRLPWVQLEGAFTVKSGQVIVTSGGQATAILSAAAVTDVHVEADVTAPAGGSVGLVLRQSGPANDNQYWGGLVNSGGTVRAEIWLKLNGSWILLASHATASAAAHIALEAVGKSLKLFVNNQLAVFAFDTSLGGAGAVGIYGTTSAVLANFHAEQIQSSTAQLPFSDVFTQPDGSQLSNVWSQDQGNFTVLGSQAVAGGVAVATLNGVSVADISVQEDVTVAQVGSAGVTARFLGHDTMYWGGIVKDNTGLAAQLWVEVGGSWMLLGSVHISTGTGTVRMDLAGSSINLFLNGASLLKVTDTHITAAGSAGLWASNGESVDNFLASAIVAPATPNPNALLTLIVKPLHLNLLGLQVQSSPITVTVTPDAGQGKLLGNLLSTVSGLISLDKINTALNNVLAATVDLLNSVGLQVSGVGSGAFTSAQPATTSLLDVMVAPVHLDLVGLKVDTSPIHLSISAQSGQGLVLGNVLTAIANLFNPPLPGQLDLATINTRLQQLLAQLNQQIPNIAPATSPAPPTGSGQILNLTVPAINLNLLGLKLQTTPITVNAAAQTGNGQLLGNVLQTLLNTLGATPGQLSSLSGNLNNLLAKVVGVLNAATLTLPTNALASLSQALQTLALPNLVNPSSSASAPILNLVIASPNGNNAPPVDVNLLGLTVTTSNINAQLIAQTGTGQVLGNLLYNVANLLNPNGPASLLKLLSSLEGSTATGPSGSAGSTTGTAGNVGAPVPVLTLTLPSLNLDLLGLKVTTDPITINLSAQQGDGKLLGNVLNGVSTLVNTQGVGKALNNVLSTTIGLLNSASLQVSGVLGGSFSSASAATTPVLDLSVAPVHLDLLGLLVDTSTIHLTISAQSGNGLVLGNVLTDLANLFNPPLPSHLDLAFINARLQQLLAQLNQQIPGIAPANAPAPTLGPGQILSLTVPAINLNLLGLTLNTTPITVNATAQTGAGLLLGNVLQTLLNTLNATPDQLSQLSGNLNNLLAKVVGVLNASSLTLPANAISGLAGVLQVLALPDLIAPAPSTSTDILDLVIASSDNTTPPVKVNLLGVLVTTSNINAKLSAKTGQGQVLGNLLSNVANLLNPDNTSALLFILTQLAAL